MWLTFVHKSNRVTLMEFRAPLKNLLSLIYYSLIKVLFE